MGNALLQLLRVINVPRESECQPVECALLEVPRFVAAFVEWERVRLQVTTEKVCACIHIHTYISHFRKHTRTHTHTLTTHTLVIIHVARTCLRSSGTQAHTHPHHKQGERCYRSGEKGSCALFNPVRNICCGCTFSINATVFAVAVLLLIYIAINSSLPSKVDLKSHVDMIFSHTFSHMHIHIRLCFLYSFSAHAGDTLLQGPVRVPAAAGTVCTRGAASIRGLW